MIDNGRLIKVKYDEKTGDAYVVLDEKELQCLGCKEGDAVDISVDDLGRIVVTKSTEQVKNPITTKDKIFIGLAIVVYAICVFAVLM